MLGEIIPEETIKYHEENISQLQIESNFSYLIDAQKADNKASLETNKKFIAHFMNSPLRDKINRIAVICSTPHQVVQSMLFIDGIKGIKKPIKVFNSIGSAINWLNVDISIEETQTIINSLQKQAHE